MCRGTDGEEFGEPLDNTEDQGKQIVVQVRPS
jgi:hypothetical protein